MSDRITIESGKFYRTRDGYKCGPMEPLGPEYRHLEPSVAFGGFILGTGHRVFRADGTHAYGNADLDLVAEWGEEEIAQEKVRKFFSGEALQDQLDDAALLSCIPDSDMLSLAETYTEIRTDNPPVLALEGGELVIKIINGSTTMVAKVGDGRYFFGQVIEMLINPALLKAYKASAFAREVISWND